MRPREPIAPLAVSMPEAAKMLGVSSSTVERLVRARKLASAKVGKRVVIPVREIERLLKGEAA